MFDKSEALELSNVDPVSGVKNRQNWPKKCKLEFLYVPKSFYNKYDEKSQIKIKDITYMTLN